MNVDELVRDSLREQAAETVPVPPGFADRVLTARRRRRTRTLASVAAATAAVVAIAVAVPLLGSGKDDVRLASEKNKSDIIAHPDQSPPRDLIAAGDTALAAYYTYSIDKQTKDRGVRARTYWLLNQKTGKYEKTTKWSFMDIAPGLRTAAVLEKDLPAKRIGLLDLFTGDVRWIPVDRGVAGVEFSPDGSKLVATTYSENPDLVYKADYDSDGDGKKNDWMPQWGQSDRTGFYVIDVDSGEGSWSGVTSNVDDLNVRQDFGFSHDGKLVYGGLTTDPHMQYYDLDGNEVDKPANEKYRHWINDAGLSPNGKLVADNGMVLDANTGKVVTKVEGAQEPLGWADDERLVVWGCDPCNGRNEYRNRLLLVTIGSDNVVPLSDFRKASADYPGRWVPMFSER
ncbi:WD40 repeat domain-containing protein [Streptomyces phyllanthi]|uniref:WD40 repeat domain-containing protein n=1 Tax=Streptomyces phyllanthi TaxID=1803180 RepID=A0A5N8WA37_9ACTN|nr:WD40 repeat domain-containing protein [Streptomyces phyllanthi]MPY44169.1 WD40 repeat domain-containing protein [Streptomyces phyllanthi]